MGAGLDDAEPAAKAPLTPPVDRREPLPYVAASRSDGRGPGGGIGRRAGFRCQWLNGREGSSPFLGTIGLINLVGAYFAPVLSWAPSGSFHPVGGALPALAPIRG